MNLSIILGMVGPWQVVIIIALALLLFGGKKIPELMKGLGQGMKEFKKATKENDDDDKKEGKEALKEDSK
ncbi:MAG: twin-arginine translocase TatA/TatE family subunit [Bacteroidales bacterium]|nr:twin-arginine translocase TatA/TatE family subunit [Bacteroidales bacterium]